jgi:hypothetical protein
VSEKVELDAIVECTSCEGTGLYVGMAERDGAAVECHTCKGTGGEHVEHSYTRFTKRKARKGVTHVYRVNPGICAAPGAVPGGVSLRVWQEDPKAAAKPGAEMRQHTCPAWWYQSADYEKKPEWKECWDNLGRSFSQCKHFAVKAKCWDRWDDEHSRG